MTDVRECAWCGMPVDVISVYEQRRPAQMQDDGTVVGSISVTQATAICLNGHYYGGPLEVLVK